MQLRKRRGLIWPDKCVSVWPPHQNGQYSFQLMDGTLTGVDNVTKGQKADDKSESDSDTSSNQELG